MKLCNYHVDELKQKLKRQITQCPEHCVICNSKTMSSHHNIRRCSASVLPRALTETYFRQAPFIKSLVAFFFVFLMSLSCYLRNGSLVKIFICGGKLSVDASRSARRSLLWWTEDAAGTVRNTAALDKWKEGAGSWCSLVLKVIFRQDVVSTVCPVLFGNYALELVHSGVSDKCPPQQEEQDQLPLLKQGKSKQQNKTLQKKK